MKQKSLANKVFNEIIKFKSDMLKSKTVKCVGKNVLPDYKNSSMRRTKQNSLYQIQGKIKVR